MVPVTGIEPVRILLRGILSPLCLPIPPYRQMPLILVGFVLLWFPKKSSGFRFSSIFSTAATRSARFICHWQRSYRSPVVVPEKIFGLSLFLDFFDHCHSLCSLYLPLAALASLPIPAATLIVSQIYPRVKTQGGDYPP